MTAGDELLALGVVFQRFPLRFDLGVGGEPPSGRTEAIFGLEPQRQPDRERDGIDQIPDADRHQALCVQIHVGDLAFMPAYITQPSSLRGSMHLMSPLKSRVRLAPTRSTW